MERELNHIHARKANNYYSISHRKYQVTKEHLFNKFPLFVRIQSPKINNKIQILDTSWTLTQSSALGLLYTFYNLFIYEVGYNISFPDTGLLSRTAESKALWVNLTKKSQSHTKLPNQNINIFCIKKIILNKEKHIQDQLCLHCDK